MMCAGGAIEHEARRLFRAAGGAVGKTSAVQGQRLSTFVVDGRDWQGCVGRMATRLVDAGTSWPRPTAILGACLGEEAR